MSKRVFFDCFPTSERSMKEAWQIVDLNGNGLLSSTEFMMGLQARDESLFAFR